MSSWLQMRARKECVKVAWFAFSHVPLIRYLHENQNKTKRNPWTNKNLEIWKCPVVQRSVALRQKIKEDGLIPEVNFSPTYVAKASQNFTEWNKFEEKRPGSPRNFGLL